MLIVQQDKKLIAKLKEDLSKSFDMKNLGPTKQILGMGHTLFETEQLDVPII